MWNQANISDTTDYLVSVDSQGGLKRRETRTGEAERIYARKQSGGRLGEGHPASNIIFNVEGKL